MNIQNIRQSWGEMMILYKILGFLFLGAAIVLILSQFDGEGDEYVD